MLNAWFGSASGRRSRQRLSNTSPALPNTQARRSDASSVSTVGPLQTPGNLTSVSDVPLDEVHAHINDPSVYAPTPSLIHSTEKETGTLRTSDIPPSLDPTTTKQSAPVHLKETLFTPQDAILAQVLGRSALPVTDPQPTPPPPSSGAPQPSVSLQTSDSLPPPPSMQTTTSPSPRVRPGPTLTIYEPFSGVKLGERTSISPSTTAPGLATPVPPPTSDDGRLWSSLERILGLQAEIAAMHAEMEGVGGKGLGSVFHAGGMTGVGAAEGTRVGPKKRSRRGQTLPIGDEETEEPEPEGVVTGGAVSEISTDHSDHGDEDEDEEDEEDIHGYGKRRRDEEFAKLAEQFTQRKTAIGRIMNKLDDLSTALKMFHTLPAPLFDIATFPSRTDTVSSAPSNASAIPSSSPHHAYPGRSSTSLSPITPPHVAKSVATSPRSLTPPIPPISTLAPPTSSGSPDVSPDLKFMIAPVLPRTALPTIIPGTPHVESPADMIPPQFIFQS